ncbi:T-cell surface glycoprotein CD5 isoform X1 [Chelonoidis abingdonii]|uniref:T-cell surface glycoprotein CD5 isoform X1 n=1 Tax=Chelonoidis abingdonii TaxID=106734 RepID=UPI0013F23798|nr:T-cell surface glycoprotein CD5 isoform X1 [Chelonoidis abingdonii]XP_032646398.1 T-cell surface glycoprotein CD5 isoform X1 [Chelonoidis abingdonii]
MGLQQPAFTSLILVGMWVTSCLGGEGQNPAAEWGTRLTGSGCRCSGLLEVKHRGSWARVCSSGWNQKIRKMVCAELGCGFPSSEDLRLHSEPKFMEKMTPNCQGNGTTLRNCRWEKSNCTQGITAVCKELEKTTTAPPPPTTPEPTGPPRLQLVDGRFHCSGFVELYMGGHSGTVQSSPENKIKLAQWVCPKVGCGDALDHKELSFFMKNESRHLPVHWEMDSSCGSDSDSIPDCFKRTRISQNKSSAFVVCSGFQPRVIRGLGDSQSPCEGVMKVFHKGKWEVLCDSSSWKKSREEQVCQELQCGKLSLSVQVPGAKTRGVSCSQEDLQECSTFKRATCSKTRITCQNFKPAGVGAGTIVSILLALILLGVLIIICGPPAYKKLQKKYAKKQQRQWIGPTGLQQNVSFHRNSTVTLRPRQEGQGAQGEDNDYSQTPKKNSYLSAYPALEGAIRSSNPPDNSSDSDYDLHSARRL